EHLREPTDKPLLDLHDGGLFAKQLPERGDTAIRDAARNNQLEIFQPGVDVEREPMARDPAGDANADRTNLFSPDPRARQAFNAMRRDGIVGANANHHLFKIANVSMHIAPVGTQIENRVADDLPGSVIGHIAPATGFVHLDAMHRKLVLGGGDMRAAVTADAKGNHSGMLEEEEQIGNAAGATVFNERLLQVERIVVWNTPEAADFEDPRRRRAGVSSRWRQSIPGVVSRRP